jgi:hypothetical protein
MDWTQDWAMVSADGVIVAKLTAPAAPIADPGCTVMRVADAFAAGFTWPKPPVPQDVSRLQAVLALEAQGLLDDVEALVAASPRAVQLAWASAPDFHRDSPMIAQLWAALGRTPAQLDDLFRAAEAVRP